MVRSALTCISTPGDTYTKPLPRYLYENGEYDVSKRVLDTAASACDDRTSLLYAQILITSGSRFYDLNRLRECRAVWEVVLKIRQEKLSHDSPSIAAIYNNLGNLETASGNLEESQDYFERASMSK
jgi:tetratricopeptide (TPR) repeat protein